MVNEIQYELWQECNSKCTYCSLGIENCHTPNEMKLQSLETTYNELSTTDKIYDVVGFIGGEFFQGQLNTPEIYEKFMNLMKLCNQKLLDNTIKNIWINATMTIGDQQDLWDCLDIFEQKQKLWVLTSYDTLGRFHTPKMLETWKKSINHLHTFYKDIKLNTTTIITDHFIDLYLNGDFDIQRFKQTYDTALFLKTPVKPDHLSKLNCAEINKILGPFFTTRKKFQQFLLKFKMKEGHTEFVNLFSNELKAQEVRKNYNNNNLRNISFIRDKETYEEKLICDENLKSIGILPCGHSSIYQSYVDSDACCICDKMLIDMI